MKFLWRFSIAFLAVACGVLLASKLFGVRFELSNYWEHHGYLFLLCITLFPRLTLLFSSVATGGLIWWLGWVFAPRLLVAILATLAYWNQDPILVVIAWIVALGGESSEKYIVLERSRNFRGSRRVSKKRR